jgi:hypothetical protein
LNGPPITPAPAAPREGPLAPKFKALTAFLGGTDRNVATELEDAIFRLQTAEQGRFFVDQWVTARRLRNLPVPSS